MRVFNQSLKYYVTMALLLLSATARVEAHGARCSDLSEHEAVLKEGQGLVRRSGYENNWDLKEHRPFHGAIETSSLDFGGEHVYSYELGELVLRSNLLTDKQIDAIHIATASDISSAEWHAHICEMADRYLSAKNLYYKILNSKRSQKNPVAGEINQTLQDLQRVNVALKINGLKATLSLYQVPAAFKRLIESISENQYLDVRTKYQLLRSVYQRGATDFALPLLPALKPVLAQAKSQLTSYEKSLGCLDLADQLNAVGFKLETQGLYSKADEMYNEALKIRMKNLGANDSATIAEYGELARLEATQKHYDEAIALYELSLANFRKLPAPGNEYGAMLQSYGDLLAQLKKTSKSDAIYAEARNYYSRAKANKS